MIKYLGSKRTLVPALEELAFAVGATNAVDLFSGTTRVAQGFKRQGVTVTTNDLATYSQVLAQCYIETDADLVDKQELTARLEYLQQRPGLEGYFTETFCRESRFFQPKNGKRIDAMRESLATEFLTDPLYPVLLTSLLEAADRVDSTTGLQMAYLKQWAPRAYNDIELRIPELLAGTGLALRGDANQVVRELPRTELMYLDPPYNQHRYYTNYHIWETLVRWDKPAHYGVACKRTDARDEENKSVFNKKREMKEAFFQILNEARADLLVVSYNNESWITPVEMQDALLLAGYEAVTFVAFDYKRYVGAQIGIHNSQGVKVGQVSHLRNQELLFLAGTVSTVERATSALQLYTTDKGAGTKARPAR